MNPSATLQQYINAGAKVIEEFNNVSFKWNDGVENELILNYDAEWNETPDYCIIEDSNSSGESLRSFWFVMEGNRLRTGQFRFALYRDLINTYYDDIIQAPCFIEKATITDRNNPLIYNPENMTFNQIKKDVRKITNDEIGCIAIYMANSKPKDSTISSIAGLHTFDYVTSTVADYVYDGKLSDFNAYYNEKKYVYGSDISLNFRVYDGGYTSYNYTINSSSGTKTRNSEAVGNDFYKGNVNTTVNTVIAGLN